MTVGEFHKVFSQGTFIVVPYNYVIPERKKDMDKLQILGKFNGAELKSELAEEFEKRKKKRKKKFKQWKNMSKISTSYLILDNQPFYFLNEPEDILELFNMHIDAIILNTYCNKEQDLFVKVSDVEIRNMK